MRSGLLGRGKVILCGIGALILLLGTVAAQAGGGFSGSSGGSAFAGGTSDAWTVVVSQYVDHSSHTFANAATSAINGGKILEGYANAGNETNSYVVGNAVYDQKNLAKAKVYAKGKNVMAKARSKTYTTITIDGHVYFVAEEVARAMARFTPIGTSAAATSETNVSAGGNGYIGVNTGTKNEATIRVQN